MHVVAFVPAYPPTARFGAPIATHRFLSHLVDRGHTVTVGRLVGVGSGHELDGVTVARAAGRDFARSLAVAADVVISHAGLSIEASDVHGHPHVRIVHGAGADDATGDLIVWNSETLRAGRPGIVCHPPTIAADHRVDRTGDHVTIVNCSPEKGIRTLWRIADESPSRQFLAVEGGYGTQLRLDHGTLRPRHRNITQWPTQQDMRTVWAETRVLLMPSACETWGMVGVEAMCSGIPVIAHPTPGLRESLGDAGIFVDRDDTTGWLDALARLDDTAEYRAASERALARADALDPTPDLDRFADAMEAICA